MKCTSKHTKSPTSNLNANSTCFGCFQNLVLCMLILKEPWIFKEQNLDFDRLRKLENWSNGAEILICGGRPSYLSNKTMLTQKKFTVSEVQGL